MQSLDQLEQLLKDQPAKPPVERWNPDLSGDIDILIRGDGTWLHEGGVIEREALVRLFASILRREDDGEYYLVTPVEKWRLQVEDAPLLAVELEEAGDGEQRRLALRLNTGEWVQIGDDHPLELKMPPEGGPEQPYLRLWRGLSAKLARPVYYQLAELADEVAGSSGGREWQVQSAGQAFAVGREAHGG